MEVVVESREYSLFASPTLRRTASECQLCVAATSTSSSDSESNLNAAASELFVQVFPHN